MIRTTFVARQGYEKRAAGKPLKYTGTSADFHGAHLGRRTDLAVSPFSFKSITLSTPALFRIRLRSRMKKVRKKTALRVCLVSHHPMVREEFARVLKRGGFALQSFALESTVPAALRQVNAPAAQVYVVDALSSRPATEALVAALLENNPEAQLLVVAAKFTSATSHPLLHLGAKALVTYAEARERLVDAITAVSAGGYWVSRAILSGFVQSFVHGQRARKAARSSAHLSRREKEVLDALLANLANKEIASKFNISERTAKFHVSNLLQKFGVRRRADLILMCAQEGSA